MYHCIQIGSPEINVAVRTSGADIATAIDDAVRGDEDRRGLDAQPQHAAPDDGRSHDVENIDAEQRDRMSAWRQRERLKPKEKRQNEDLEPAFANVLSGKSP